jgi:hypothetical protein
VPSIADFGLSVATEFLFVELAIPVPPGVTWILLWLLSRGRRLINLRARSNAVDVLQLDVSGRPQAWISANEAAAIYATDGVSWTLGQAFRVLRGGTQQTTG